MDVRGLQDEQATHANIEKEMRGFASRVGPNDVFVLYLAGHGAASERQLPLHAIGCSLHQPEWCDEKRPR